MKKRKAMYITAWFGALILIVCMFTLNACNTGSEAEKGEVLGTVKRYNSLLMRTYMEAHIDLMKAVTTDNQLNKILPTVLALRAKNNLMMADQKTFEVKKVSVMGKKAIVETEEEWIYWWQHKDTREITEPMKVTKYSIRYILVVEDDGWKVDSLETTD
jgi:hypothetical protein